MHTTIVRRTTLMLSLVLIAGGYGVGQEARQLPLTLREAVHTAARRSPVARQSLLQWRISQRGTAATWGRFEPELVAEYTTSELERQNDVSETVRQFGREEYSEDSDEYSLGVEGGLLSGGSFWFGYSVDKLHSSLMDEDSSEFTSFAGIRVEQPLLRGLAGGAPLVDVRVQKREELIAFHTYRRRLMQVIGDVELAYWRLAAAQTRREIAAQAVQIARDLVDDSAELFDAGRISELEMVEANAGLAVQESQLAAAEQELEDARAELALLLFSRDVPRDIEVVAVDSLAIQPEPIDMETILSTAYDVQPDYLIRSQELARQETVTEFQRGQRLPEVNIRGSYGVNGLGATFQDSLEYTGSQSYPTWSLSVEGRIPLLAGVQARNQLAASRLREQIARDNLDAVEYELERSVSALAMRVRSVESQLNAARQVVDFRRQQLSVERSRLEAGRSSESEVFEVQTQLAQARQQELDQVLRYRESRTRLALVSGSMLIDKQLESYESGLFSLSSAITEPSSE
jgi:outer membrane protein TolC